MSSIVIADHTETGVQVIFEKSGIHAPGIYKVTAAEYSTKGVFTEYRTVRTFRLADRAKAIRHGQGLSDRLAKAMANQV